MLCAGDTFEIQSHRQIGNEKVKTVTLLQMINNEVGDNIRQNRYEAGNGYMEQIMTWYINKLGQFTKMGKLKTQAVSEKKEMKQKLRE